MGSSKEQEMVMSNEEGSAAVVNRDSWAAGNLGKKSASR